MGTTIPIPLGSYQMRDPRASCKHLVGCFSTPVDTDAPAGQSAAPDGKQTAVLQRMHGTSPFASVLSPGPLDTQTRGMWQLAQVEFAVIGATLYEVTSAGSLIPIVASVNQITGTGFVRMTDNGQCLVILVPGTNQCWTYSLGGGFQKLTSSFFLILGAIDCWFVDSFIVFLAINSNTFYNDDGVAVSGSGQITFTTAASFTREFGTDPFVGGTVDHREILLFGSRTSEGYVNVGAAVGTPFQSAPDSFITKGCDTRCAYTVAIIDEAPIWVANDLTVRRRNGQTPVKISNAGIDQFLMTANLSGCYAITPTVDGHPLWVLICPNAPRTIAYDCLTTKWFDLVSMPNNENNLGYWRPLCFHNNFNRQLLGDSLTPAIGYLDPAVFTEYSASSPMLCQFTTQGVYNGNNRLTHRRLECVVTAGRAQLGQKPPGIDMYASDDGYVFDSFSDPETLGGAGEFDNRSVWWNLGQSRNRIYMFQITDPTPVFAVDIQAELEGGKW